MNVTSTQSAAPTTTLILNSGRVPVIRGKTVIMATNDVITAATTTNNNNNNNTFRGMLTTHGSSSGGTSKNSSNSNSQSFISAAGWGRSPGSTSGTTNSAGFNEGDYDSSPRSEPMQHQNGLLVQYAGSGVTAVENSKPTKKDGMATIADWLNKSPHQNGFIRVFLDPSTELAPNSPIPPLPPARFPSPTKHDGNSHMTAGFSSILVPCSLATTVEQICSMIGISPPSLCVQLNSGKITKLSVNDRPLQIQTTMLARLGFDPGSPEIMREGIRKSLSFVCRFLSAKQSKLNLPDVCKRISSYLLVKRPAPVLKTWERRLCSLCGSKLQIHKLDQNSPDLVINASAAPNLPATVFDLAGATVTESTKTSMNRSHPFTVRVELTSGGTKRMVKLAFDTPEQKLIWTRHLKLAATNQSRSLDLSGNDLELLPEAVFQIAEDVQVFNLKDNQLLMRPNGRGVAKIDSDDNLSISGSNVDVGQLNPAVLGFLDDIARFRHLQILNLSNNDLYDLPKALYELTNLTDLNLGNNKIRELSSAVQRLQNLKQLNCQSNRFSSVPAEILSLRRLVTFNVSFNRFSTIPETLARLTNMRFTHVEELQLAGNCLGQANDGRAPLTRDVITVLEQVRKIDLRFNAIARLVDDSAFDAPSSPGSNPAPSSPLPLAALQYCTILDLSFNRLENLDLREMKSLENINVSNNRLSSLILNGTLLKQLNASYNKLDYLHCDPNPDFLEKLDVSKNAFKEIPMCFHNCPFLISANYGHNSILSIPGRYLFNNRRLRFLRLHGNVLSSLDEKLFEDLVYVEELYLQSNAIAALPDQLFNRAVKLKVLNVSRNKLRTLPRPLASLGDISRLQALYLTGNQLTDDVFSSLLAFPRLKFLHLARNRLTTVDGVVLAQLEFLQDLNVSENLLTCLPNELSFLSKLQTLRAHTNGLVKVMDTPLPEALQVLDLSSNRLSGHVLDIFPRNPLHLSELDISGNTALHFGDGEFIAVLNEQLQIMAYDDPNTIRMAGSNIHHNGSRSVNGVNKVGARPNAFAVHFGVARTAGSRNKPSVFAKTVDEGFRSCLNESMAALFDGGLSSEVPKILQNVFPELIEDECEGRSSAAMLQTDGAHMKRAFLSAHRELKAVGQRLGASAAVCHFVAPQPNDQPSSKLRIFVGNVGDVEVLLCYRDGSFHVLTEKFRIDSNTDDISRAVQEGCVITDNCKLNGVSDVTRMLGCGYLFPAVIPSPNIAVYDVDVGGQSGLAGNCYATVVIANRNLWRFVSYADVCQEVTRSNIDSPLQAAKRLLDLAQCFGATENIGIVVAQLLMPMSVGVENGSGQSEPHHVHHHHHHHHRHHHHAAAATNGQVMSVKPWNKERQTRKMAELNGNPLTVASRTSTTASLRRTSAGSLPPAASLDLNPYAVSVVPPSAPNGHERGQQATNGQRGQVLSSSSSNDNTISSGDNNNNTASRRVNCVPSGDDTASTGTTENSTDTIRTAIWVPHAVLHQYSGGSVANNANNNKPRPKQQPQQQQALSIRVEAADNPRRPRQTPAPTNNSTNANSGHQVLLPMRLSPPSTNNTNSETTTTELASKPSSTVAMATTEATPPVATAPATVAPIIESSTTLDDATLAVPSPPNTSSASNSGSEDAVAANADDSVNSAVNSILVPPPAPFGDFEFVSYL